MTKSLLVGQTLQVVVELSLLDHKHVPDATHDVVDVWRMAEP